MHDHLMSQAASAPGWLISSLGVLFLVFALFYTFRLLRPSMVRKAIGFYDPEGEAGHAICMLAMSSHLAYWLVPISATAWIWLLGFGTVYYALRALTWGRLLSYNKQWWDWTHSGMYLGMFVMFQPLPLGPALGFVFDSLLTLFWLWFSLLYIRDSYVDLRARKTLSFGSDLAHLGMGLAMLVMSLFPALLMPHHHHGMNMTMPDPVICTSPQAPADDPNQVVSPAPMETPADHQHHHH